MSFYETTIGKIFYDFVVKFCVKYEVVALSECFPPLDI